jgi:hypothetical protein
MILWVASYPRSGNTLVRIMLKEVFGCTTYARHFRPQPPGAVRELHDVSGMVHLEGAWPEKYAQLSQSEELCVVKSHSPPEDNGKAVYVARNGFATIISYYYYLRDWRQKPLSLEEIILGKPKSGSWGYHLDLWQPLERPNTLLLKYEDLVEKPEEQIAKLSDFCGLRPQKGWVNEFDKLHALNPAFFRKGQTGDASAEFSEAQRDLFWSLHGDWMQRLGYATAYDPAKALPQLRKSLRDHVHAASEQSAPEPDEASAPPETKPSPVRRALAGIIPRINKL